MENGAMGKRISWTIFWVAGVTVAGCDYIDLDPVGFPDSERDSGGINESDVPVCGDGIVNGDEECDDGINDGAHGECQPGCVVEIESEASAVCGDGIVNGDEECDDGINDGAHGECQPGCVIEVDSGLTAQCGNGIVEADEECDDGVNDGGYGECQPGCVIEIDSEPATRCGDGILQIVGGETCDDGNNISGDGCSDACQIECDHNCDDLGNCLFDCDAILQSIEEGICSFPTLEGICCGDGIIQSELGEYCDDGNRKNDDECSSKCIIIIV